MIKNRKELKEYLSADMLANNVDRKTFRGFIDYHFNPRIKFIRNLRFYEYWSNKSGNVINKMITLYYYYKHKKLSYKLGYTIYKNNFGKGLFLGHYGTLVVNKDARIGENCRIHVSVNIGGYNGGVPVIGNNVYIGPGAKIFGPITIGDNVIIGANAVVNKSFPDNVIVAGVPAKIIKNNRV